MEFATSTLALRYVEKLDHEPTQVNVMLDTVMGDSRTKLLDALTTPAQGK